MNLAKHNYSGVTQANLPSGFKFNPKVWSEPFIHEYLSNVHLPTDSEGKKITVYKKAGIVLKLAEVPVDPGIYLIRLWDDPSGNFTYIGTANNLLTRLSTQLNGRGVRYFQQGKIYEISYARTAVSSLRDAKQHPQHISTCGVDAHYIAEGLAILFLKPLSNDGMDWKGKLRKAFREGNAMQVLQEAERLGFWCGSQRDKDGYMAKLISEII